VDDITKDFKDGVKLINLLEILSGQSLGKYVIKCKIPPHNLGNINLAINWMCQTERIRGFCGWDATDIMKGNIRVLLGITWILILHYELQPFAAEPLNLRETLILWLNEQIALYDLQVKDFVQSFQDGKVLSALINILSISSKDIINVKELKNPMRDTEEGIKTAEELYRIPQLVDPEDMHQGLDELSTIAYINFFRMYYHFERPQILCVEELKNVADLFLLQDLTKIIVEYYAS